MLETDRVFAGSIPDLYDSLLVPMIFESSAHDMAERALSRSPGRVLETAAGTGVVTRALAARLPPEARIVATDLNPAMIEHAAARLSDPRVDWAVADAQQLPYDDAVFDVGICQYGAMFFPDRVRAYSEMRRVLRPGGAYLLNIWDAIETHGVSNSVTRALAGLWPDDPPMFLARTPHGHGHPDIIRAELTEAGFASIGIERRALTSVAPDAVSAAMAFCQGSPLRGEIEAREPEGGLERATTVAAEAVARDWAGGRLDVAFEAPMGALVIAAE